MNENKLPYGLSAVEALQRCNKEGFNELEMKHNRSTLKILFEVVREPMFLLLLSAGGIYLIMGDAHEAIILLGFVFVIMGITIIQERRTEKVLEALRDLSSPRALVIRNGVQIRISGREVVRGDTLILNEGDRIPADGFILSSHDLATDESMLSGESVAIAKYADDPSSNKLYAGTLVVRGQAIMEATAIGIFTELGKIGKSLQSIENEASPLQKETALLTKQLAIVGIALCFVVIVLFVLFRGGWLDGILAGITLAMGVLPQEFPVIMIIFMALGARRIAQHNVLTRRLSAIETLGKTTVLCVDKTGTLTKNQMAVAALALKDKFLSIANLDELPEDFHEIVEYCILASQTDPHDPMEKAFFTLANRYLCHTEHLHFDWDLTKKYELAPDFLAMTHLWQIQKQHHHPVATKGAPEAIIDLCHLDAHERDEIMQQVAIMADQGLRVLGVAKALHIGEEWPAIQHDFEFKFLGLVGLADPLRDEVPQAVLECRSAGIRIVMITGDHPRTAKAIAKQAGIDSTTVVTGAELETLHGDELAACMQKASVFARVTPKQKLQIVEALKNNGEIVAMTGDGVNDAPALKSAHIGIAMGKRGTDVAREAASLVLLEDNFGAIVEAIKLGRRIFANLRHAMIYTIAVHIPIIGLSIIPIIFGLPLVLAPIHIVFLELIIDPACSVVFEAEEATADIMTHPPRVSHEHLISSKHLILSLLQGVLAAIAVALLYWVSLSIGIVAAEARAMAFIALVGANTVLIFNSRSYEHSFRQSFTAVSNIGLWVISATLLSLMLVTLIPSVAIYFSFAPPSLSNWLIAFGAGISMFVLFEIAKKSVLSYSSR